MKYQLILILAAFGGLAIMAVRTFAARTLFSRARLVKTGSSIERSVITVLDVVEAETAKLRVLQHSLQQEINLLENSPKQGLQHKAATDLLGILSFFWIRPLILQQQAKRGLKSRSH